MLDVKHDIFHLVNVYHLVNRKGTRTPTVRLSTFNSLFDTNYIRLAFTHETHNVVNLRVHVIGTAVFRMVVGVRVRSVIVVVDDCPCLRLVGYDLTPGVRAGDVIAIPAQPREPEQHEGRYEGKEPAHS